MSLRRFLVRHPQRLSRLHHYQLGIVFMFILSFILFVAYLMVLENYNLDQRRWGWYFILPWAVIYSAYCLHLRNKVTSAERVSPLKRPLGHWIIMGLSIVYFNLVKDSEFQRIYPAFNFAFLVFTLFLADSYWDFKKLKYRKA